MDFNAVLRLMYRQTLTGLLSTITADQRKLMLMFGKSAMKQTVIDRHSVQVLKDIFAILHCLVENR